MSAAATALARAALAGNPSDGYGGATLAVTLPQLAVRAELVASGERQIPLVSATLARFDAETGRDSRALGARFTTQIPVSVGLGGSSAIVIAVLRALCAEHRVELAPARLAEIALAVERDDLGIPAGMQDRVAQAFEGLVFMEFDPAHGGPRYERLDPRLLPPLALGWIHDAAEHSGLTHGDLRSRFEAGDPGVRSALAELAETARAARDALVGGNPERFALAVDATFDLRTRLIELDERHTAMIASARAAGAAANYTGSGGAIVAVCDSDEHARAVAAALAAIGCDTLLPGRLFA